MKMVRKWKSQRLGIINNNETKDPQEINTKLEQQSPIKTRKLLLKQKRRDYVQEILLKKKEYLQKKQEIDEVKSQKALESKQKSRKLKLKRRK